MYYVASNEIYHHGILGQKWGVRRYQNPDGSLTTAGKKRYQTTEFGDMSKEGKKLYKSDIKVQKNLYSSKDHLAVSMRSAALSKQANKKHYSNDAYFHRNEADRKYEKAKKIYEKNNPGKKFKEDEYIAEYNKTVKNSGKYFIEKTKQEQAHDIATGTAKSIGVATLETALSIGITTVALPAAGVTVPFTLLFIPTGPNDREKSKYKETK